MCALVAGVLWCFAYAYCTFSCDVGVTVFLSLSLSLYPQKSLLFHMYYPDIEEGVLPRHRFMSCFEQRLEPPDKRFQYLIFAAEPYENVGFKVCDFSPFLLSHRLSAPSLMSCCTCAYVSFSCPLLCAPDPQHGNQQGRGSSFLLLGQRQSSVHGQEVVARVVFFFLWDFHTLR